MTDRERLIELQRKAFREWENSTMETFPLGFITDYLLANGVIVAPMPMADWLREELTEYVHERCMEEL